MFETIQQLIEAPGPALEPKRSMSNVPERIGSFLDVPATNHKEAARRLYKTPNLPSQTKALMATDFVAKITPVNWYAAQQARELWPNPLHPPLRTFASTDLATHRLHLRDLLTPRRTKFCKDLAGSPAGRCAPAKIQIGTARSARLHARIRSRKIRANPRQL